MCDEYEHSQSILRSWRRARKSHRCYACREVIRPGDRYHIAVEKDNGDVCAYKHCARCWAMCEALWAAGATTVQWDLDCGELWEDEIGDVPDEVGRLAFLTPDEAQRELVPALPQCPPDLQNCPRTHDRGSP